MLKVFLGLGAAGLIFAALRDAFAAGSSSSGGAPVLTPGTVDPNTPVPDGAAPEGGNWGTPRAYQAAASSGTVYVVWMYAPDANGLVYTIARLAASTLWVSFLHNGNTDKRTPAKTNATGAVLDAMRRDWRLG